MMYTSSCVLNFSAFLHGVRFKKNISLQHAHIWTCTREPCAPVPETGQELAAASGPVHEEVDGPAVRRDGVVQVIQGGLELSQHLRVLETHKLGLGRDGHP